MSAGARAILARAFGQGESPLAWGVTIAKLGDTRIRLHLVFVVWLLMQMAMAPRHDQIGFAFIWPPLVWLVALVLARECLRATVCRRLGGEAHEVVLWPLGSITGVTPDDRWPSHLKVGLAGVALHAALVPALAGGLLVLGVPIDALLFNPFSMDASVFMLSSTVETMPVIEWLWWGHVVNAVLLLGNLLAPMFPLDAAEVVRAVAWSRVGRARAQLIAANVGLATASVLAIIGAVGEVFSLVVLAIFGGLVSFGERRGADTLDELGDPEHEGPIPQEAPAKAPEPKIDDILEKISRSGLDSLSKSERAALDAASSRGRAGSKAGGPVGP